MGKYLSTDVRSRVILAVAGGLSRRAAADRFALGGGKCDPLGARMARNGGYIWAMR